MQYNDLRDWIQKVDELGELMGDAAKALQAGLHELMPRMLRAG